MQLAWLGFFIFDIQMYLSGHHTGQGAQPGLRPAVRGDRAGVGSPGWVIELSALSGLGEEKPLPMRLNTL